MDNTTRALKIIEILRHATKKMTPAASDSIVKKFGHNPYLILISTILSLRTRDTDSLPASLRLFERAKTPQEMIKLPISQIEKLIYPCGFYRVKAQQINNISKELITAYNGDVPNTREGLMSLKGVGPKTAALVLAQGFGIPAICVDVHVHRISNRLGLVKTETPEETEEALMRVLPPDVWIEFNQLLVVWGQNICTPISPFCSRCAIYDLCERRGVVKSR